MRAAERPITDLAPGGAGYGWRGCLRTVAVDELAKRDTREMDGTVVATAAYQDARWRRGEVARLRWAVCLGLVTCTVHAAAQAVPGRLRSLPNGAAAPCARARVGGAVCTLPAEASRFAWPWARCLSREGPGLVTPAPQNTCGNTKRVRPLGIWRVPFWGVSASGRALTVPS
jgi:hypothetical protein